MKIVKDIIFLRNVLKRYGYKATAKKIIARLFNFPGINGGSQYNIIKYYGFILGEEQGFGLKLTLNNLSPGSMTWVIPDFSANSGGHINIFRMLQLLQDYGFPEQHVVIMEPCRWLSSDQAKQEIHRAFGVSNITVSLGVETIEPCEYLFATGWQTAYWVAKYKDTLNKLYFVQDFEPDFYAQGSEYLFAENTYRLGLTGVTAGTWLSKKLAAEYGMKTFPYSFSCDSSHYKPTVRRYDKRRKYIFFYARPVTPRRCFEMGLLALKKVCDELKNATVVFAGWDVGNYKVPFSHMNHGSVSVQNLPELYSQCDAALILSSTNLSLLPLEVAACGCPVIMNNSPQSNWLLSEDKVVYCDANVEAIAAAIMTTLQHPEEAKKRADKALRFVKSNSWKNEARKVANFLKSLPQLE